MKTLGLFLALCLPARPAMMAAGGDAAQAAQVQKTEKTAGPAAQPLTEEEADELAARDEVPGEEVKGGALSNLHLTYAIIALATAVLVLIAVR